tara:strand:- start:685 stop:2802 length:2118 start_codon:yes stop_codon:yes gene_type:complete
MKKLKVLLCDARHSTIGAHSNYVPLGIGFIGSYIKDQIKDVDIELVLSIDPEEIFKLLKNWKPDVVGCSNYIWNSQISNVICEVAKEINPDTLCIIGGPEFPAGTGQRNIKNTNTNATYDKCLEYLLKRPCVDYYAWSDGEVVVLEILQQFIKNNFSVENLKKNDNPIKGSASISKDKKTLLVGEYLARIGMEGSVKSEGRDTILSPYTTGLLDKFLDGRSIPAFETAKGCPFMCTFCDQGLDASKVTAFSTKRLMEEFWYVGEKMSKHKEGTKVVAIFDSNWGLFEKDVDLANNVLGVMDKYDWPEFIECLTPKSNRENLLKINDVLKNRVQVGLSMQSMNIQTLSDIKRKNWTTAEYLDFVEEIKKRGKAATSEMIIPLPGETKETYFEGIEFLMEHNIQPGTYTLMMLDGAELGRDAAIKRFGMKGKWRILPKQFGKYNGKKVFETEQACIETNTMSFDDYIECRNYSFILRLISSQSFLPIYKLAKQLNISWFEVSKKLSELVQDKNFKGKLKDIFDGFCKESQNELFETQKEAMDFYEIEENYKKLVSGDIGDNLLGKYSALGLLHINEVISAIFYIMKNKFNIENNEKSKKILESSEKWLKNIYMIDKIFDQDVGNQKKHKIEMNFDFPSWLTEDTKPINSFIKDSVYEFSYDKDKLDYLRRELNIISASTNEIALGKLLLQQAARSFNIFEKQYTKIN